MKATLPRPCCTAPDSAFITIEQYSASRAHRGAAEIQADGAAYVLADLLGLDTEQTSLGT